MTHRALGRDRFLVEEMKRHLAVIALGLAAGRDRLASEVQVRYSVEHAVELLAEAAKKTSSPFRERNPQIDWAGLRSLRKALAHPYEADAAQVEVDELWRFARDDAPRLERGLARVRFSRETE